jgi:hypothetical protein
LLYDLGFVGGYSELTQISESKIEVALKQVNTNPSFCLLIILIFNFVF